MTSGVGGGNGITLGSGGNRNGNLGNGGKGITLGSGGKGNGKAKGGAPGNGHEKLQSGLFIFPIPISPLAFSTMALSPLETSGFP